MSSKDYKEHLPSVEEFHKSGLKMLIIIVNRADGEKTTKFLREQHLHMQFTCMAEGTQGMDVLALLGLGSVDKTVVFCISAGARIDGVLPELTDKLTLKKAGRGIAFTIPLTGIKLPHISHIKQELGEQLQDSMEKEVDKMNEVINHSVVLAVVDHGNSEELVKAAKNAGARGGTVINARRTGTEDVVNFFGISIQAEKEIVAILTNRTDRQNIMKAINDSFGANSSAHGIVLSLPVDSIAGVEI